MRLTDLMVVLARSSHNVSVSPLPPLFSPFLPHSSSVWCLLATVFRVVWMPLTWHVMWVSNRVCPREYRH